MTAGHLDVSYIVTYSFIVYGTSKVIGTSSNLADILDFWRTSTSHEIGGTTSRKLAPKIIGVPLEFCRYVL